MSQENDILAHLKSGLPLDPMEALRKFNCWALSSRISDLKKKGHPVRTIYKTSVMTGKTYAEYIYDQKAYAVQSGQQA